MPQACSEYQFLVFEHFDICLCVMYKLCITVFMLACYILFRVLQKLIDLSCYYRKNTEGNQLNNIHWLRGR